MSRRDELDAYLRDTTGDDLDVPPVPFKYVLLVSGIAAVALILLKAFGIW